MKSCFRLGIFPLPLILLLLPFLGACNLKDNYEPVEVDEEHNGCGGDADLFFENATALPGQSCGACDDGVLTCDGPTRLRCTAATARNACDTCGPLAAAPDTACGPCGDGVWTCQDMGVSCEGASQANPCGGCGDLGASPGGSCEVSSEEAIVVQYTEVTAGTYACAGPDDLRCVLTSQNACGGTAALPNRPGSSCGSCGGGVWACDGPNSVICEGEDQGVNDCGGCAPLAAAPGAACGRCNGQYTCEGDDRVICDEPNRNACGSCEDFGGNRPGDTCAPDSLFVCSEDALACTEGANNPCGGVAELSAAPGDACGTCGTGYVVCTSLDATACVASTPENACGGCALLPGNLGDACGQGGALACDGADRLQCDEPSPFGTATVTALSEMIADGEMIAPINVTLTDSTGEPLPGVTPQVAITGDNYTLYQCSPTNAAGRSRCGISTTEAGPREVTVTWPVESDAASFFFDPPWPFLTGTVQAVHREEDMILLGGNFIFTGDYSGSLVRVQASGEKVPFGQIVGLIQAIEPDGSGGLFVAGSLSHVGGTPTERLVHIDSQGQLLPTLDLEFNGNINALVHSGERLYVGGTFSEVDGEPTGRLVGINTTTGELLDTDFGVNSTVTDLQIVGSDLVVIGAFTQILGASRGRGARIRLSNHSLLDWNPAANSTINALVVDGSRVFLGGFFTQLGGLSANRLATVNTSTGALISNDFPSFSSGISLLALSDDHLYAAGQFTLVDGDPIWRLVRMDRQTGELDSTWTPDPRNTVQDILWHNDHLLVGGFFTSLGRELDTAIDAFYVARFDADGDLVAPPVETTGQVSALRAVGNDLFVGGSFDAINPQRRRGLLAIDPLTGEVLDQPAAAIEGSVSSIVRQGDRLAIGGYVWRIDGEPRQGFGLLSLPGLESLETPPAVTNSGYIDSAFVHEDGFFLGGYFFDINDAQRVGLAELDLDGVLTSWAPLDPVDTSYAEFYGFRTVGPLLYAYGYADVSTEWFEAAFIDRQTGEIVNLDTDPPLRISSFGWSGGYDVDGETTYIAASIGPNYSTADYLTRYTPDTGMTIIDLDVSSLSGVVVLDDDHLLVFGNFTEIQGVAHNQFAVITREETPQVVSGWAVPPQLSFQQTYLRGPLIHLGGFYINPEGTRERNRQIPRPGLYP